MPHLVIPNLVSSGELDDGKSELGTVASDAALSRLKLAFDINVPKMVVRGCSESDSPSNLVHLRRA